jgi:hypothetical protein
VRKKQRLQTCGIGIMLIVLVGCSTQARYMRGWQPVESVGNRWTGGTLREQKLSEDEATVFAQLGTPAAIRFFRSTRTRQRVYAWIYEEKGQVVWFVDGQRVDYIAVDTNTSAVTQASREATQEKLIEGGGLAGVVGGIAAGFIVLSETIGLRE